MKKIFFAIALILFSFSVADAVPAYPGPIKVTQPDGSVLTIRVHGDEYLNWITCGNSLVAKGADGYYRYASFGPDGATKAQGSIVRATLSGDGSSVKPTKAALAAAMEKRQKAEMAGKIQKAAKAVGGSSPFLVMLIQYQDVKFIGGDDAAKTAFTNMLNQQGYSDNGGTGSARDYYTDNSHGKFTPVFDVVGPVTVKGNVADYLDTDEDVEIQNGAERLLRDACWIINPELDFSKYDLDGDGNIDNVFFYFAGHNAAEGAAGTIWPHSYKVLSDVRLDGKWLADYACTSELKDAEGDEMTGIGTFCHEFGHSIGLPDFYDTDYGTNGLGLALSSLSLMSSGNYNNGGNTPPYLTYEERRILGWDNGLTILKEGLNTLSPISDNSACYCPTGHDGEYYLFESRPATGWDAYTNAAGMAVYHVDKSDFILPDGITAASKWKLGYEINIFADHQCMDLVETVVPESNVHYYDEMVFPGKRNVTELNAGTAPALTAWNGASIGYGLSDISFDENTGISSFQVDIQRQISGAVVSLNGVPVSGVEITAAPVETSVTSVPGRTGSSALQLSAPVMKAGAQEVKVITGADGTFVIPVSVSGDYSVSARKDGYVPYSTTVNVDISTNISICLPTIQNMVQTELKKYSTLTEYTLGKVDYVGYDWYGGVRFSTKDLEEHVGSNISSVSFSAYNGGDGTALEMGVKVFFDNEEVLSRAMAVHVFNTICTVDISDAGLTVPEGKSVLFMYYILGSSCYQPLSLADIYIGPHITDACLCAIHYRGDRFNVSDLNDIESGNLVISAIVSKDGKIFSLAGFNMIHVESSGYKAGDMFELKLDESSSNPPSSVTWYVNGEAVSEKQIVLSAGTYVIKADLTYSSGRKECVETRILAK